MSKSSKSSFNEFKKGDKVQWNSIHGVIQGTIIRKLTTNIQIKDHHVKSSEDDPQYLVKSDKTGAEAAHKPDALTLINDND